MAMEVLCWTWSPRRLNRTYGLNAPGIARQPTLATVGLTYIQLAG